jgi:hypothetical protein
MYRSSVPDVQTTDDRHVVGETSLKASIETLSMRHRRGPRSMCQLSELHRL